MSKAEVETPAKNPSAVILGRLGGRAGKGKVKSRGDSDYYATLAGLAVAARLAKAKTPHKS